jgi:hypothetical protein
MGFLGLPVLMGDLLLDEPMITTIIYIVKLFMRLYTSDASQKLLD